MTIDPPAFAAYRASAGTRATLPRLALGTLIVVVCWVGTTFAVLFGGLFLADRWAAGAGIASMARFMETPLGTVSALSSFAGIWIGIWLAMRLVHREPLAALFGVSRRLSGFVKGLAAVLVTSVLSEAAIQLVAPGAARSSISLGAWLVALLPLCLLAFIQTSSEELMFRGYLMRGLARRFRSPLAWALPPGLVFTMLHWNGTFTGLAACILLTIGAFTALLTFIVWKTGNLGAAMGAHFGNNIVGFLFLAHEESFSAFSLYAGVPLDRLDWTFGLTAYATLTSVAACLLTAALLFHSRSPLRLSGQEPAGILTSAEISD